MASKVTSTAWGTTGVKTITTTFLPASAEFEVFLFGGATGGDRWISRGWTDGTNQNCQWDLSDTGVSEVDGDNAAVIRIKIWNGATWVDDFVVTKDSFNATSLKVNVTTANPNYTVRLKTSS